MPLSGRGGARATLDLQEKYTGAAVRSNGWLYARSATAIPRPILLGVTNYRHNTAAQNDGRRCDAKALIAEVED